MNNNLSQYLPRWMAPPLKAMVRAAEQGKTGKMELWDHTPSTVRRFEGREAMAGWLVNCE